MRAVVFSLLAVAGHCFVSPLLPAARGRRRCAAASPTMGVPKFFRWLTERFPQVNRQISAGRTAEDYVDNFYLDMNGIIHTCTHGDAIKPGEQLSEAQMVDRIFEYTERLIRIARPRKLCYLAIDGVAPRAKMNQQRSRRYRAPREAAQLAAQQAAQGIEPPTGAQFDSNCITPGTEFLSALGERYKSWIEEAVCMHLTPLCTSRASPRYKSWIEEKMRSDPEWRDGPTVVFSGADVVGEGEHRIMAAIREGPTTCLHLTPYVPPMHLPGEHKIMAAIREGRASGEMGDETRHCMYGLDADLIMLGLVTHAPKFCLLRERQKFQKGRLAPRARAKRGRTKPLSPTGILDAEEVSAAAADDRDFIFLEV